MSLLDLLSPPLSNEQALILAGYILLSVWAGFVVGLQDELLARHRISNRRFFWNGVVVAFFFALSLIAALNLFVASLTPLFTILTTAGLLLGWFLGHKLASYSLDGHR